MQRGGIPVLAQGSHISILIGHLRSIVLVHDGLLVPRGSVSGEEPILPSVPTSSTVKILLPYHVRAIAEAVIARIETIVAASRCMRITYLVVVARARHKRKGSDAFAIPECEMFNGRTVRRGVPDAAIGRPASVVYVDLLTVYLHVRRRRGR